MHLGLPFVHLKAPSWHSQTSEIYECNQSQQIVLQMVMAQTTSRFRFIAAISAILITITNPRPWDAIHVSKGAIEIINTTIHLN